MLDSRPDWKLRRTCAAPAPGLGLVLHFIDSCFVKMQTEDIDCLLYDCMLQSELERKRFEEQASHHLMR